ncbi:MAG: HEAT repeat domain-containing protein [Planctomycetota bacterium]
MNLARGVLALLALLGQERAEEGTVYLAVTRGGLHVECSPACSPGDLEVKTPLGMLRTPLDPVEKVVNGAEALKRVNGLRPSPAETPADWIEALSREGFLTELEQGVQQALQEDPGRLDAYKALEAWGARIDPVPDSIPLDHRVGWLWEKAVDPEPIPAIFFASRLAQEAHRTEDAAFLMQVPLTELRRALRSRLAHVRRAAALVAGRQEVFDLIVPLLEVSLRDSEHAVRDAAAWACGQIHRHDARQYWTLALAQGRKEPRLRAAENLGIYGGPDSVHALANVLSAWDRKSPARYPFAQRTIQTVRESQDMVSTRGFGRTAFDIEVLDQGSVFKVTLLDEKVTRAILKALDVWAGRETGRSAADWLQWYEKAVKPSGN